MKATINTIVFEHEGKSYARLNDTKECVVIWALCDDTNFAESKPVEAGSDEFFALERAFVEWNNTEGLTFTVSLPERYKQLDLIQADGRKTTFWQVVKEGEV